jgi:hypothetical protein
VRLCRTRVWQRVMPPHLGSLITACSTVQWIVPVGVSQRNSFTAPFAAHANVCAHTACALAHTHTRSLSQSLCSPPQGPFGDVSPLQLKTLVEDKPPEYEVFERTRAMLMVRLNSHSFCRAPLSPVLHSGGLGAHECHSDGAHTPVNSHSFCSLSPVLHSGGL